MGEACYGGPGEKENPAIENMTFDEIKKPRRSRQSWGSFIKGTLTKPKCGKWQDMCLAPVDTWVELYSEREGFYIGACVEIERPEEPGVTDYMWHRTVGGTNQPNPALIPCNPQWWRHLGMRPPKRPEKYNG